MITKHTSYRQYLKNILEQRCSKNPRYSLRAMAKQIGVSPATLSGVFNSKKNFSLETANSVAKALGLKGSAAERFILLVQIETTRNQDFKNTLLKKLHIKDRGNKTTDLSLDYFRVISDWYHYALLSLCEIRKFMFTPTSIPKVAKLFGITKVEVQCALERLEKLGMISLKNGIYVSSHENICVKASSPNAALRNYHKQLLQKAMESIDTQLPQEKIIGSETIAIDSSLLNEFSLITEEYFNKVLVLAQSSQNKDQVYHLGVQFFRLNRKDII